MIVTKQALPRRAMLRGLGAAFTLPLLDAMVPALTAAAQTAAAPPLRFGVVYVPNGMVMQEWTPQTEGAEFDCGAELKPLEPFRDRLLVLTNLASTPPPNAPSAIGVHARASTRFLTAIPPKRSDTSEVRAGESLDQRIATHIGGATQLASLEFAIDGRDLVGSCDIGFSCAYTNTISWRRAETPLPMENDPRVVFERMFGGSTSTDRTARLAQIAADKSILDSVMTRVAALNRRVSVRDRAKVEEYLEAVRDVERRIRKVEQQSDREFPLVEQPAGIPSSFEDHVKLMFDMQLLAYQSDLTRVVTFMMGRELSGRTFPGIGVVESHHATSHHSDDPVKIASLLKIKVLHSMLFAYYLERLASTRDGDGSLLDSLVIMYGCGMGDPNRHAPNGLALLLAGGGAGRLRTGRHVKYASNTPLANLHLSLLDMFGIRTVERIGDSSGQLDQLAL